MAIADVQSAIEKAESEFSAAGVTWGTATSAYPALAMVALLDAVKALAAEVERLSQQLPAQTTGAEGTGPDKPA